MRSRRALTRVALHRRDAWMIAIALAVAVSTARPSFGWQEGAQQAPPAGPTVDENDDNDNASRRMRVNAIAKLDLPAGKVLVTYPLLASDGPDATALASLAEGEVLPFTRSMAIKLKTEVELRFDGGAVARPENVSPGYAGVYSLWLKRAGAGWRLVLNREPDIWGTMRDPAADVGETALAHQQVPEAEARKTLEATLLATNGGGELAIVWGEDRFTAHFEAGAGMNTAGGATREGEP